MGLGLFIRVAAAEAARRAREGQGSKEIERKPLKLSRKERKREEAEERLREERKKREDYLKNNFDARVDLELLTNLHKNGRITAKEFDQYNRHPELIDDLKKELLNTGRIDSEELRGLETKTRTELQHSEREQEEYRKFLRENEDAIRYRTRDALKTDPEFQDELKRSRNRFEYRDLPERSVIEDLLRTGSPESSRVRNEVVAKLWEWYKKEQEEKKRLRQEIAES